MQYRIIFTSQALQMALVCPGFVISPASYNYDMMLVQCYMKTEPCKLYSRVS